MKGNEGVIRYKIGKKYVRGDYKDRRFVEKIKLVGDKDIHSFLWDMTDLYSRNKCNFVIEWYRRI